MTNTEKKDATEITDPGELRAYYAMLRAEAVENCHKLGMEEADAELFASQYLTKKIIANMRKVLDKLVRPK